MKMLAAAGLAAATLMAAAAPAQPATQPLTVERARTIIAPWYALFNVADGHDVKAAHEQVYTGDFQSCSGDLPKDCHDRNASIAMMTAFKSMMPDLRLQIRDVMVAGDKIIVRSEATGTPVVPLFGAAPTGKGFRLMGIDILTVRGDKVSHTYHLENWVGALEQMKAR